MPYPRAPLRVLFPLLLLTVAACRDVVGPGPEESLSNNASVDFPSQGKFVDAEQVAIARRVPGFGGVFFENGVPTAYLTDLGESAAAEQALAGFAAERGIAASRIQFKKGDYNLRQLSGWFGRMSADALDVGGAVYIDLDEARNRVSVGVENAAAAASVRRIAVRLGVPVEAVIVEEVEPILLAATLRDLVRPTVGGLQINFGNYACTLGFNAVRSGENSYITNSHCTNTQGGVEGTQHYQPLATTSGSFIGTEVADPTYQRNLPGCPRGRHCRYSDASRGRYAAGVTFDMGGIAQTTGANNGSLTIAGTFNITSEGSGLVGQTANKVGRTTGWTSGQITNTCVHTNVSGSRITQLCQSFVSAGVGGGDSGSPVFRVSSGTSVSLIGILWGGSTSGAQFVFSPLNQVEQELGALTTF